MRLVTTYVMLVCLLILAGCASFKKKPDTVWDMYNVRRFNQTGPITPNDPRFYSDNDATYVSPQTSFGLCADTDLAGFSCE